MDEIIVNQVDTDWKPNGDQMVLTLQVGTWSKSNIKFNRTYIQMLVGILTNWLKGQD